MLCSTKVVLPLILAILTLFPHSTLCSREDQRECAEDKSVVGLLDDL